VHLRLRRYLDTSSRTRAETRRRTVGSRQPFPFCSDSDGPRKLSQIVVSGASYTWNHFDLVQMIATAEAHKVTVTAKLADGTMSTAQVTTPALIVY